MDTSLPCPSCKQNAKKLIGAKSGIFCNLCYESDSKVSVFRTARFHSLGWKGADGVSNGKSWEIDNRVRDRESGKIVNRITGKPAQY